MDIATKLVIGLGNPGKEYDNTRHNIGFMVADAFAQAHKMSAWKSGGRALAADGRVGDARVFVLKPQTFMNLSGEAAALFLRQKPLALEQIMVVTDDIALPLGRLRLRAGGSAGGHNGLKSLIAHLHSAEFPRLRFGVGAPSSGAAQIDYVLGRFGRGEQADVEDGIARAVAALDMWIADGLDAAMNQFNR